MTELNKTTTADRSVFSSRTDKEKPRAADFREQSQGDSHAFCDTNELQGLA